MSKSALEIAIDSGILEKFIKLISGLVLSHNGNNLEAVLVLKSLGMPPLDTKPEDFEKVANEGK